MRKLHVLTALLALAAAAACGDDATAPTDADLMGTWTITPTATALPGGDVQEMTVHFGADGAYTLESSTWGPASPAPLAFGTQAGSVSTRGGELRFYPSTSLSVGRRGGGLRATGSGFDLAGWDASRSVAYEVVGNHLVLHLPSAAAAAPAPVLVLTRSDP
jgi:hypothetical protein